MLKDVELNEKQFETYQLLQDKETNIVLMGGNANSGKSWIIALFLISQCKMYPNSVHALCRKRLKTLKMTSLVTFKKCCKAYGIKDYKINLNDNIITFGNGSKIYLVNVDYRPSDPQGDFLGGMEFTSVVIDEVPEIVQTYFEALFIRIREGLDKFNIVKKMLCTCNPSGGWVREFFYDRWVKKILPNNIKFINTAGSENPFRDKSYKDGLSLLSESSYRRLELGDWDFASFNDKLFDYDKIESILSGLTVGNSEYYISADIARFGEDSTVIIVWKGLTIIDIIQLYKSDITNSANEIRKKMQQYNIARNKVIVDSDGLGGGVVDILRSIGFNNGGKPLKAERFYNIKSQMYFKLSKTQWSIDINIKDEFKSRIKNELDAIRDRSDELKYRINSKDDQKILLKGISPDIIDAIMMRMYFEYKGTLGAIK